MRLQVEIYADPAVIAEFQRNIPTLEKYLGNNGISAKVIVVGLDEAIFGGINSKAAARSLGIPKQAIEDLKAKYGIGK